MAFNPSQKVAVARDYARAFKKDVVVIFAFNSDTWQYEFASYGETKALCNQAKLVGDKLWPHAGKAFVESITEAAE